MKANQHSFEKNFTISLLSLFSKDTFIFVLNSNIFSSLGCFTSFGAAIVN